MKKIAILGSTGSIGTQTLEVVRNNPELQVAALAAGKSVEQMEQQIREFHPLIAGMWSEEAAADLRSRVADLPVKVVSGMDGLLEIATMPQSQVLVTAIVGMIGIRPTIAAIEAGKDIALANKETLVTAGHIIMPLAAKMGVKILPVDSEHSAIFQSLNGEPAGRIEKILLTASGGPFRGRTREQLQNIQVEDALKHPNWSMGRKITIDSSTLVNKGLEVMEVKWLFGVDLDQIQVIVHPQSIIHSAVQYVDGAVIAQLGTPDMKLPIQYALFYPDRRPMPGKRLDFYELAQITFEKPDMETFFGLKLAYDAQRIGGSMPTVYNAANEKAVGLFLDRKIAYLQIPELIREAMEQHKVIENPNVEEILEAARAAGGASYEFRGVVCLVDAVHFLEQRGDLETVNRQLKHCHLAVITKTDLVSPAQLEEVIRAIREINPVCPIEQSRMGSLSPRFLQDDLLLYQWAEGEATTNSEETKPKTLFLDFAGTVTQAQLSAFLQEIQADLYRCKGFFHLSDAGWSQIDLVGSRLDSRPCAEKPLSQLVFISRVGPAVIKHIFSAWETCVGQEMKLRN